MKKNFSFLFLAASLFLFSCKKETINEPGNGNLVSKKMLQSTVNGNTILSYNADGSIKKLDMDRPNGLYTIEFTHTPGKVNYIGRVGNFKDQVGEYTMVNGRATTYQWTYFAANGDPIGTFNETFAYNTKGLLEKHVYNNGDYYIYNYDANDNLILSTYYAQGQAVSKREYVYGNEPDRFPSYGYFYSWGEGFVLPPLSKHLPVKLKATNLVSAQVDYEGTLAYDLDADGYVLKGKWHTMAGNYSDWDWTNTFE